MNSLAAIIHDEIKAKGAITIERYMELALQHPDYGYYRNNDPLGASGDFTTAPEISQMFGEMIGLWLVEMWQSLGKPTRLALLEFGAGRGTLMSDALRATKHVAGFHESISLYFCDTNRGLREKQKEKTAAYNPTFIDSLTELPEVPLLVVANEFFDALPVRQLLEYDEEGNFFRAERKVDYKNEKFVFVSDPPLPEEIEKKARVVEVSPGSLGLVGALSKRIAHYRGAFLLIDYGTTAPSGAGTLQAVAGHRSVDFLDDPGRIDLTAHVDFFALAQIAVQSGTSVFGAVGQGDFLSAMGIDIRARLLQQNATDKQIEEINIALDRLISPDQMGTLFKAMAIVSKDITNDVGFA